MGGALLGGASTASGAPTVRLRTPVSSGEYPFEAKKGVQKSGLEDLEGGACSHNLYTSGPRPRRIIKTLRDPPRPGPAHPREHGDSAAPKSLDPKQ